MVIISRGVHVLVLSSVYHSFDAVQLLSKTLSKDEFVNEFLNCQGSEKPGIYDVCPGTFFEGYSPPFLKYLCLTSLLFTQMPINETFVNGWGFKTQAYTEIEDYEFIPHSHHWLPAARKLEFGHVDCLTTRVSMKLWSSRLQVTGTLALRARQM